MDGRDADICTERHDGFRLQVVSFYSMDGMQHLEIPNRSKSMHRMTSGTILK